MPGPVKFNVISCNRNVTAPVPVLKTRLSVVWFTVRRFIPGPIMEILLPLAALPTIICPSDKDIGLTTAPLKVMVCAPAIAFASSIAERSEILPAASNPVPPPALTTWESPFMFTT